LNDHVVGLRRVTLREEKDKKKGEIVVSKEINGVEVSEMKEKGGTLAAEYIAPDTGEIVIYYEDSPESDFKISVLAGNVKGVWKGKKFVTNEVDIKETTEMRLKSTAPNRMSLVIMIECFGQKIMVCGDATAVTEYFMCKYFAESLKGVQILRLAHHGSPSSSSRKFIGALTAMTQAVASTGGKKTVVHYLPKEKILSEFDQKLPKKALQHDIFAFKKGDTKSKIYFSNTRRNLHATGSNDTFSLVLTKPKQVAVPEESGPLVAP
jgi:hypothetical protein